MSDEQDIHIHVHVATGPGEEALAILRRLDQQGAIIVADLSAITTEVTENGDAVDSAVALLGNLAQQIRDLSTDPAALQALADQLDAQTNDLAAAVVANTPAGPTPEPAPAPPDNG